MRDEMKKVPRLRFRGFSEDWELCKLEEIVDVRSGRDYKHLGSGNIPVYGTGGYMLSVSEALSYDEDAIGIGRKGTINNPYILKAPFWTVDTLFYTVPKNNFDLNFIYSIFRKINWKSKDESTGVPSLSKTTINAVTVYIPSGSEQQRIGKFFKQLDDTITLHQRKLDQLKKLKKAYLQAMFVSTNPKNNKVPKLRFTDFEGDWELCKLGVMAPLRGGFAFKSENFQNSGVRIVRISNIDKMGKIRGPYVYCQEQENDTNYLLPNNSVLLAMSGATTGKVAILSKRSKEKYYQNQRVGYFQKNIEYSYDFIAVLVQSDLFLKQLDSVLVSGAQPNISSTEINNFNFMIPKNVEEQNQIGIFIKNIDNTITFHQNKLTQLKSLKKSYLQNMFI
ncbi:restriction endonuclease subunit S [Enterococcus faecalis]|uniref:restriction endonuclease subunit S n=1 Tax=Enterococcus faecalis TaxID=1351 RepID=UPI000F4EBC06|nr:restriction endonuclease subunit S [Enterococcus faecalis]EGO5022753.1 restriction endonuclease subunit S [Enterococcus faecalis]EGO8142938.1 restriction endonuclease subunit S [Enterococcus faecalis]EGS1365042.1 restriction endonuclease subunit S [Enterococcus faecalis]EGS7989559.1 restriction endonuclease subunit S [Enterococcus faecalis]EKZ0361858.1 restriction endonuclease subunit S [Enterococcus faecalis]